MLELPPLPACACDDMAEINIRLRQRLKELQEMYAKLCAENIELRAQLKNPIYKATELRRAR